MKSEEAQMKGPRLEKPVRITKQVWPEGTVPVVSVFCITYNHVNFIRDAIEGFLMQETTFPVEIFIHDDASSDGTAEIVKEYADKYPKLFWTILQTENQWSKGNPNAYFFGWMQKQRGEFIALCEGDDYWITKEKLQKQVDFLEQNSDCALVAHQCGVLKEGTIECPVVLNYKKVFNTSDILPANPFYTCSLVFRNQIKLDANIFEKIPFGDWIITLLVSKFGKACLLPDVMGVYRMHSGGTWLQVSTDKVALGKFFMYEYMKSIFPQHHKLIFKCQMEIVNAYCRNQGFRELLPIRPLKFALRNFFKDPVNASKICLKWAMS